MCEAVCFLFCFVLCCFVGFSVSNDTQKQENDVRAKQEKLATVELMLESDAVRCVCMCVCVCVCVCVFGCICLRIPSLPFLFFCFSRFLLLPLIS